MRSELDPQDLKAIADAVIEILKPLLANNTIEDELLTVDEVADLLKTTKAQIYQWVNNSQHGLRTTFPYLKAGKLLRFSKKAVLKWLESR